METTFYQLSADTAAGKTLNFDQYKGKVVLVVNTASKCGLAPQYAGLEELHKKYAAAGLVVLGFPSDQFAGQEPLSDAQMEESCLVNHGVSFTLMKKSDVNGSNANAVFSFLKTALPGTFGKSIKWNFTKFLIDKSGKPVKRYAPITKPKALEKHIQELLSQSL